jgi:hypothetical protein
MKTAISVPDDVFEQAEQTAKRLGLSRSELFSRAMRAFLATSAAENVTKSYDAAFGEKPVSESESESFGREAARRALLAVEWE